MDQLVCHFPIKGGVEDRIAQTLGKGYTMQGIANLMGMYDTPVVYVGVMDNPYTAESFFTVDSVVVTNDSSFEQYSVQLLLHPQDRGRRVE